MYKNKMLSNASDDGECPDGFVALEGSCYLEKCPELKWKEAHEFCEAYGANIVVINSMSEGEALNKWLHKKGLNVPFWAGIIGLGDYIKTHVRKRDANSALPYQCILDKSEGFRCFNPGTAITICEATPDEYYYEPGRGFSTVCSPRP